MFFAAAIAAAFHADNIYDVFEYGLAQIPKDCLLAQDIRWAVEISESIKDYKDARNAVDARFGDMSKVHTNINACLTIFGLTIGGNDFTKVIGQTVAMGYDNDCTAATAGSIFGALYGIDKIPLHWYKNFNNKVLTYINGHPEFQIDDLIKRFTDCARIQFGS
jgi:ADP-ribosylglycohydrolase